MKTTSLSILAVIILFCSCKKASNGGSDTNCQNIQNVTIASNSPVTIGQTIQIATPEVGGYRIYSWIGPNNYTSQSPADSLVYAELKNEGWYYLDLYSLDDQGCQKIDSVYIDVKLQQGTPPCTVSTNTVTYNNLFPDNFSSVTKGIESTLSLKALTGSGGVYSNIIIYFHPNWRTMEPEDGIYTTINTPLFDQVDYNYNKVFITTTKNSIYWSSAENQTVYISHVGTKLQVRFCDLEMGGSNGTSYTTLASGNVVEL